MPDGIIRLPSGRQLDLTRSRWDGPLDAEELAYCRTNGVPLAYDCAQIGWVVATCADAGPTDTATGAVGPEPLNAEASRLASQVRRVARVEAERVRTGTTSVELDAAACARVRQAVAPSMARVVAQHGLRGADACHWCCEVALGRELPTPVVGATADPAPFTFRAWNLDDAAEYRRLLDEPRLWEFLPEPYPDPLSEDVARTLIEVGSVDARQETLAVVAEGGPVGQCLLRLGESVGGVRAAEVAYWLGVEHWGKGWMTRILRHFLLRSFKHHRIDVVFAWIREDHGASVRVAEHCGFNHDGFEWEGELALLLKKPRFRRYATLRSNWPVDEAGRSALLV